MLNRNKGFLLVEVNMALLLIVIAMSMFAGSFGQLLQGWQRLQADVKLYRAARYSFSLPERELFLHADRVSISSTGIKNSSKLICQDVFGSREISFYLSGVNLYREIKSNSLKGVNVISLASVRVENFQATRLNDKEVLLTLQLKDIASGKTLTSSKVMLLRNGVVE